LGKCFLVGKTEDVWDEEKGYTDYIAVADTGDALSNHFARIFLRLRALLRRWSSLEASTNTVESLNEIHFKRMMNGTLAVVASVLPVLPIVVLFLVRSQSVRIGLVVIFTVMLSAVSTFGLHINAERTMAITTAFAAVLVVFIATSKD
jgi:predicted RND superfamily exporter protein